MARLNGITAQENDFLDMIGFSEGTLQVANSDDGYRVLVGGGTFESYADHPRKLIKINDHLSSTAAGRYQILAHIYDYYKPILKLKDFSPGSQDSIALQMIKECHSIDNINNNDVKSAIINCHSRWASFPGADYGQHENKMQDLVNYYQQHLKENTMSDTQPLNANVSLLNQALPIVQSIATTLVAMAPSVPLVQHIGQAITAAIQLAPELGPLESALRNLFSHIPATQVAASPQ